MEQFIRIAFWIVTLSGCLQARSLPMSDSSIDLMRTDVTCPSDSTFYAPTNVKGQCITTALDCVMRELNGTVSKECDDPNEYIEQAIEFLELKIKELSVKGHALTNSSECACETWPQIPLSQFLNEMESLLQLQNANTSLEVKE